MGVFNRSPGPTLEQLISFPVFSRNSALIDFVDDATAFTWLGYMYAVALFAISCLRNLVLQHVYEGKNLIMMRARTALMTAVYRKVGFTHRDKNWQKKVIVLI